MEGFTVVGGIASPAGTNSALKGAYVLTNVFAAASTTVAAGTNIVNNTPSTVNVGASTGFNSSGGEFTVTHAGTPRLIKYTGTGSGTLLGASTIGLGEQLALTTGDAVIGGNGAAAPTSGTAYQLVDIMRDYTLFLNVTTAGTATTISLGPTSAVGTIVPVSNTALPTGLYSIPLPAGWYFKLTTTSGVVVPSAISR